MTIMTEDTTEKYSTVHCTALKVAIASKLPAHVKGLKLQITRKNRTVER